MGSMKHNRILPILLAMVFCLTVSIALTGCETEPKTLEDYLTDSPSAQQEIEESLSGLNNNDMDVSVAYDQNRIIITGDMKTTYKKRVLKAMKKSYKKYMQKHLEEPMLKAISSIEQDTGIEGVSIQVIINNGNGEEIWSGVYPEEEVEEITTSEDGDDSGAKDEATKELDESDSSDKKQDNE